MQETHPLSTPETSFKTTAFNVESHERLNDLLDTLETVMAAHFYVPEADAETKAIFYRFQYGGQSYPTTIGVADREIHIRMHNQDEQENDEDDAGDYSTRNDLIPARVIRIILDQRNRDFYELHELLQEVFGDIFPEAEKSPEPDEGDNGIISYTLMTTERPETRYVSDEIRALLERFNCIYLIQL